MTMSRISGGVLPSHVWIDHPTLPTPAKIRRLELTITDIASFFSVRNLGHLDLSSLATLNAQARLIPTKAAFMNQDKTTFGIGSIS